MNQYICGRSGMKKWLLKDRGFLVNDTFMKSYGDIEKKIPLLKRKLSGKANKVQLFSNLKPSKISWI
jgi:hypothetical protein